MKNIVTNFETTFDKIRETFSTFFIRLIKVPQSIFLIFKAILFKCLTNLFKRKFEHNLS